ncbi:MAG: ATP-binding protein [Promethearchaeota archaeon]
MININNYNIYLKRGKCNYCPNSIIIDRKYSGERLCPECFEKSIEKIIYKTISKFKMFKPHDKIVVALSGGKDSTTLLYNLIKIQEKSYHSEPLIALIIDEGIKDYRENSIKLASLFCKKYDIEHKVISFKEKIGKTLDEIINIKKELPEYKYGCNYCALIRRRLLNDGARELGGTILAMGHNLTDIAETYLMNILYKRLTLISNQYFFKQENQNTSRFFIKKVMPLIKIPEEEIFLYANIKKFNYYPSHCPYREKDPILRKRVLGFIQDCKKYSPEIEFNLLNCFMELSEILYNFYDEKPHNFCQKCAYPSGNSKLCSYCNFIEELDI